MCGHINLYVRLVSTSLCKLDAIGIIVNPLQQTRYEPHENYEFCTFSAFRDPLFIQKLIPLSERTKKTFRRVFGVFIPKPNCYIYEKF